MTGSAPDLRALAEALAWQIELGADEAVGEAPLDRFAEATRMAAARGEGRAAPSVPAAAPGRRGAAAPVPAAPGPQSGMGAPPRADTPAAAATAGDGRGAAALAADAGSLSELAARLEAWEGSELKQGARSFVFSDGVPGARVMVIGEAPGAEEDRRGKPFVGRAGQLLDRMLGAIGLSRAATSPAEAVYIANILPWRPPGNRTPSDTEVSAVLPFVERHIQLSGAEVVLSVGNTPTKALLATSTGIRRMRGTWHRHAATGLPLLPSFHPAYLLRQPAEKALAWRDLLALRRVLDGAPPEC